MCFLTQGNDTFWYKFTLTKKWCFYFQTSYVLQWSKYQCFVFSWNTYYCGSISSLSYSGNFLLCSYLQAILYYNLYLCFTLVDSTLLFLYSRNFILYIGPNKQCLLKKIACFTLPWMVQVLFFQQFISYNALKPNALFFREHPLFECWRIILERTSLRKVSISTSQNTSTAMPLRWTSGNQCLR